MAKYNQLTPLPFKGLSGNTSIIAAFSIYIGVKCTGSHLHGINFIYSDQFAKDLVVFCDT